MEEKPSFSSRVESLHEEHPFRVIFEQVKKNLAHVGISVESDGQDEWLTFFDIPHRLERYEWEITVTKESGIKNKAPHIDVVFEQDAVRRKVAYVLTLLPDHFKLEYSLEDGGEVQYWKDFSGTTVWYKNGVVKEENIMNEPGGDSYANDRQVDEPDVLSRLLDIVRNHEHSFRMAERDEVYSPSAK
jgi:hypothetical protein